MHHNLLNTRSNFNLMYKNIQSEKYCLLIAENMTEPNEDVIKVATILNFNKKSTLLYKSFSAGSFLQNETPACL